MHRFMQTRGLNLSEHNVGRVLVLHDPSGGTENGEDVEGASQSGS